MTEHLGENVTTETREVGEFVRVALKGVGKVVIAQGERPSVTVEAREDLLPMITTEVENGTLVLNCKDSSVWRKITGQHGSITFNVVAPQLSGLAVSGAGTVEAGRLNTESFDLKVSGAAKIALDDITAKTLAVALSGPSKCVVAGSADTQTVTMSGPGSYSAAKLDSRTVTASISGVGKMTLLARESLDASVSGVGRVEYYGKPSVTERITGVGTIRGLGDPPSE